MQINAEFCQRILLLLKKRRTFYFNKERPFNFFKIKDCHKDTRTPRIAWRDVILMTVKRSFVNVLYDFNDFFSTFALYFPLWSLLARHLEKWYFVLAVWVSLCYSGEVLPVNTCKKKTNKKNIVFSIDMSYHSICLKFFYTVAV